MIKHNKWVHNTLLLIHTLTHTHTHTLIHLHTDRHSNTLNTYTQTITYHIWRDYLHRAEKNLGDEVELHYCLH